MAPTIQQTSGIGVAERLCDIGRYREAAEALGPYIDDPEYLLIAGTVASVIGSLDQIIGSQESAKDLLTKSARFFAEKSDPREADALGMLAWCYWRTGEIQEGLITANAGLKVNPKSFKALLAKAEIQTGQYQLGPALKTLELIDYDNLSIAERARFHNQRAVIYAKRAEGQISKKATDARDKSIGEFDAAAVLLEESGHLAGLPAVYNNLAELYRDCRRFTEAHKYADRAISLWSDSRDQTQLARGLDTKARIYLTDSPPRFQEALKLASQSVSIFQCGEQTAWLAEAEITLGRASIMQKNEDDERELIRAALEATEGSTTKAAILLGLTQPGLAYKLKVQYPELLSFRKTPRKRKQPQRTSKIFRK